MYQVSPNTTKGDQMKPKKCECADPACPACLGECVRPMEIILYRVDMDGGPVRFCSKCGDDALESGLFDAKNFATDDDGEGL